MKTRVHTFFFMYLLFLMTGFVRGSYLFTLYSAVSANPLCLSFYRRRKRRPIHTRHATSIKSILRFAAYIIFFPFFNFNIIKCRTLSTYMSAYNSDKSHATPRRNIHIEKQHDYYLL